jgi:hypothetical protein
MQLKVGQYIGPGAVVIVYANGAEDCGFESRQGVCIVLRNLNMELLFFVT